MIRRFWILSLAISASLGLAVGPATAQQSGGILKFFHRDSPASMSIREEATISTVAPMMGVFNNLVLFKQEQRIDDASQRGFRRAPEPLALREMGQDHQPFRIGYIA